MQPMLITGGDGVLASYFSSGVRISRSEMDITDAASVARVCAQYSPTTIIHTAALTDLAECEQNPEKAYLINTAGTLNVALAARAVGAKLVYVSTSDVFDGTKDEPYIETDIPNPVTAYGRSKHLGELAVMDTVEDHLIVRVSWMFGGGPNKDMKFVGKVLAQKGASEIRAVADKRGSPAWAKDVASAIETLIQEDVRGIQHLGGGIATRYDMAEEIVAALGWNIPVVSVDSSEFASAYPITENQSMPLSSYVRPWRTSLREYIATEWGSIPRS